MQPATTPKHLETRHSRQIRARESHSPVVGRWVRTAASDGGGHTVDTDDRTGPRIARFVFAGATLALAVSSAAPGTPGNTRATGSGRGSFVPSLAGDVTAPAEPRIRDLCFGYPAPHMARHSSAVGRCPSCSHTLRISYSQADIGLGYNSRGGGDWWHQRPAKGAGRADPDGDRCWARHARREKLEQLSVSQTGLR